MSVSRLSASKEIAIFAISKTNDDEGIELSQSEHRKKRVSIKRRVVDLPQEFAEEWTVQDEECHAASYSLYRPEAYLYKAQGEKRLSCAMRRQSSQQAGRGFCLRHEAQVWRWQDLSRRPRYTQRSL
jgi:hypothetical protein